MRAIWAAGVCCAILGAAGKAPEPLKDPVILSAYPFAGQRGTTFSITLRGNAIGKASSVFTAAKGLTLTIEGSQPEPPNEANAKAKTPPDLVRVRVQTDAQVEPGVHSIRLVTPYGVSNALPFYVTEGPVTAEPEGSHESAASAVAVPSVPATYSGRIDMRGETDFYAIDVRAGQTLTFDVVSGLPSTGAAGGNARGFDPSISIYEPTGSWFDPKRVNRIAFNDEPLWVIGQPTDAWLVHRFAKAGRYFVRVEAFSGQGGPDYGYRFQIRDVNEAPPKKGPSKQWQERTYTRRLSPERMNELARRGGKPEDQPAVENYRAAAAPADTSEFRLPGTLEGALDTPGASHRARFRIDSPKDIAIEVETPGSAPPLFNPIVRLLDAKGNEVATNIQSGRGACTGAMFKGLQPKAIIPLRDTGEYTVEIRETTADLAETEFRYRVQVRPQVPHIGDVRIDEDHVNLRPGDAKSIRVVFDREEDYRGAVAVSAESLPAGVSALAGADFEPDKDPPAHPGKRERYIPRTERTVLVFAAAGDAPATAGPQTVRIAVRPLVDGKPGAVIATKTIPMMVVAP